MSEWWVKWTRGRAKDDVPAAARLFCFAHAGGGAAAYRTWPALLPSWLEVRATQLPGRAARLREPPLQSLAAIAARLHAELLPLLDRPFVLFGHSMGAVVAAEVCRLLEAHGDPAPAQLIVSGRRPPGHPDDRPPLRHLDDDAFVVEINRRYGAIPPEIAAEREVLALLLPGLRADIAALETHAPVAREPLASPILALGGEDDALTPREHLEAWRHETRGECQVRTFAGGHFYLEPARRLVIEEILRVVAGRLPAQLAEASS